MGEEVPHIDPRRAAIGQARFEVGQELCDRIIKIEPATLHQGQRSGRHDRLGERCPSKLGVQRHGNGGLAVCVASGERINGLAMVPHKHYTDHPTRRQRLVDDRVNRLLYQRHAGHGVLHGLSMAAREPLPQRFAVAPERRAIRLHRSAGLIG